MAELLSVSRDGLLTPIPQSSLKPAADSSRPSVSVLVVGFTGDGKSALCNALTAKRCFRTSGESESCTTVCQSVTVKIGAREVAVIDTPGLGDTRGKEEDARHVEAIAKALKDSPPCVAIIFVVNATSMRNTSDRVKAAEVYASLFGASSPPALVVMARHINLGSKVAVGKYAAALVELMRKRREQMLGSGSDEAVDIKVVGSSEVVSEELTMPKTSELIEAIVASASVSIDVLSVERGIEKDKEEARKAEEAKVKEQQVRDKALADKAAQGVADLKMKELDAVKDQLRSLNEQMIRLQSQKVAVAENSSSWTGKDVADVLTGFADLTKAFKK